jgi:phosphomannomutase/phosphoglucomutase
VAEDKKFALMDNLQNNCIFDGAKIVRLDGMRVEYSGGWGLVRASNTTPNLTLRFEADDHIQLEKIKTQFRKQLGPFINHLEDYI